MVKRAVLCWSRTVKAGATISLPPQASVMSSSVPSSSCAAWQSSFFPTLHFSHRWRLSLPLTPQAETKGFLDFYPGSWRESSHCFLTSKASSFSSADSSPHLLFSQVLVSPRLLFHWYNYIYIASTCLYVPLSINYVSSMFPPPGELWCCFCGSRLLHHCGHQPWHNGHRVVENLKS